MNKAFKFVLTNFFLFMFASCHEEQIIPVEVDFSCQVSEDNHTSPLVVTIINNTRSADEYHWTFEGGEPAVSSKKNPGTVTFTSPGEHAISLEAWNTGERKSKILTIRVDSAVMLNFSTEVVINSYAPAQFRILNLSSGGGIYKWTFEGGEPAFYEGKTPPLITYPEEGQYTIILTANNGSADYRLTRSIEVGEALDASFTILPSFEDIDDMEAPLRATFNTHLQGVESLYWSCEGGRINHETSSDADVFFEYPGNYTIYLRVSNGKEEKTVSREITVRPNTNLRTHKNIRFGINTAQATVGSVYSTRLRQGFKSTEINSSNGALIDIAFLGLNINFVYNCFVSPDKLYETPLAQIPFATATRYVNCQEKRASVQLTETQFESMTADSYLKDISFNTEDMENDYFTASPLPRVVLFETADGRKGAVLVKEIIRDGMENSYILTDIKIQKND